jgi:hypothetical protein
MQLARVVAVVDHGAGDDQLLLSSTAICTL